MEDKNVFHPQKFNGIMEVAAGSSTSVKLIDSKHRILLVRQIDFSKLIANFAKVKSRRKAA